MRNRFDYDTKHQMELSRQDLLYRFIEEGDDEINCEQITFQLTSFTLEIEAKNDQLQVRRKQS